ncbi:MAG TPA: BrxA/BrxB family bacilliredoxin [Ignavibacteriaceae bacterium]
MFNIISRPPMYDPEAVQPMRDELIAVGFTELLTMKEVDEAINVKDDKTVLVMINSVCGCAAGSARPGVSLALQHTVIPDKLYTGFAGMEREAVDKIRHYVTNFPPSSPSVALFKNGEIIYFMQRYDIEGRNKVEIAEKLKEVFNEVCTKKGPSISPEDFAKVEYAKMCGSKIPLFKG